VVITVVYVVAVEKKKEKNFIWSGHNPSELMVFAVEVQPRLIWT